MTAYEHGLRSNDTRFLLRPDSNFFKYFNSPSGAPAAFTTAPAPASAPAAAAKP
jgi:membrane protease subunit HflC